MLTSIDGDFKRIILSDELKSILQDNHIGGESLLFSQGNSSIKYKLKSDLGNFDKIILSNTLIDIVIQNQYESFEREHMEILMLCCGDSSEFLSVQLNESWLKVF